jgi:hypothetical protein
VDLKRIGHGTSSEQNADGAVTAHVFDIFTCTGDYTQLQKREVSDAYWDDPKRILADMKSNPTSAKYAGGFRASLPKYLHSRET